MDLALVSATPIVPPTIDQRDQLTRSPSTFSTTLAASSSGTSATLGRAEAMVGERIRAPEGGCGCDAFVSRVAPNSRPEPQSSSVVAADLSPIAGTAVPAGIGTPDQLTPGSVVVIDPSDRPNERERPSVDLSWHQHQAIVRNATEMITTNVNGVIEVMALPRGRIVRR